MYVIDSKHVRNLRAYVLKLVAEKTERSHEIIVEAENLFAECLRNEVHLGD
jgi:hypothetical protein